jgi:hypothetical protein
MQIQLPGRRSLGLQGGIDKRNLCVTDARGVRWGVWMIQEIPNINWLAVLVAAILRIVVGSVWFSPVAFVKPWQQLTGVTPDSMQRGLARAIIVDFILSLVMAFVLYHAVMYATNMAPGPLAGLAIGFLNWLGFVLATHLPLWAYENRSLKLIAIGTGSNLVSMLLMGLLFGLWH